MASYNSMYQKPLSSSELTKIHKNRMIYANYIMKVQNNNAGCDTSRTGLEDGVARGSIIPDLLQGARFTTQEERDRILASSSCPIQTAPAPTPSLLGGSMLFSDAFGSTGTQVTYPNNASLAIGQESFTIEWFQYWTSDANFQRVFAIGSYDDNTTSIGVSLEGDILIWNGLTPIFTQVPNPPLNAWTHIALVGTSGTSLSLYVDGTRVYNDTENYDFTDSTTALSIGNETTANSLAAFIGQITNFRWVKGSAVYSGASITVPTAPLTAISGTQLLLLASNETDLLTDSSPANRTPTNTGVSYSATSPF